MTTQPESAIPVRRRGILGCAAGAAVGLAAGLAGGVSLGQAGKLPEQKPTGRRRFEDKVVIVTGGTSGIGRAATIMFAAEGGKVAFCGRNVERGAKVEQEIRATGGEATFIRADVREEADVRTLVEQTVQLYGRLNVAFNNAGISIERPLHEFSLQQWDDVINTDLRGVFLCIKHQIPPMLAAGGGAIVITSSSNAIATSPKRAVYSAAKRGLVGLVQSAALEYASQGIRINTLIPGTTDTPMIRRLAGMENIPDIAWRTAMGQWAKSNVPGMQRLATAEEVAAFALTLASDDHPFITGAQLVIDGGKTAKAG
jgi:NAD(P)-dependent dehydrogenase (short-subunit alcohol dehydrogenase family)